MISEDREARQRQRAWQLLGKVENHPRVRAWLQEAEECLGTSRTAARANAFTPQRALWAMAATVVIALGCTLAYFHFAVQRYETRIGEQRDVVLPDGSRITLNTNTSLVARYSKQQRNIELERGEALFAVRHDVARPFVVAAGGTLTRALGTEFNVDVRKSKVTVSVLEGAVQVVASDVPSTEEPDGRGKTLAALVKGQALEFRPKDRRAVEEKADLTRIDAWRTRRLEFSNTPLSKAVEEFNRYATTPLVIGTTELGSVRVSGVFRIGDTEAFLYSLREALGVQTHESASEVVLLRAAS